MILAQFAHFASHTVGSLAMFQEDQAVGFSPMELWDHMGWAVRFIAIVLRSRACRFRCITPLLHPPGGIDDQTED